MNTKAVTKAKLTRTIEALEAMGKTVGGIKLSPDGCVHLLIGPSLAPTPVDDDDNDAVLQEFRREHGYG